MNMQNATLNGTRTPNTTQDPWHPQATTPGASLPQGDALVAYENVKRAKNSEGNENGEIKFDINVRRV